VFGGGVSPEINNKQHGSAPHHPKKKCNCDNVAALTRVIAASSAVHPSRELVTHLPSAFSPRKCYPNTPKGLRGWDFAGPSDKPQRHIVAIDFKVRSNDVSRAKNPSESTNSVFTGEVIRGLLAETGVYQLFVAEMSGN